MPLLSHSQHQKTAFITGASSGIGRAIAEKLLSENHRVWGTSRDPARLADLAQKHPATFTPVTLDLADPDAAQAAFEAAADAAAVFSFQFSVFSPQAAFDTATGAAAPTENCKLKTVNSGGGSAAGFDLVINNAGYGGAFAPFAADDFDRWRRQIDAMLLTTARLSHAALRGMISRNHGTLVNVSSLVVNFPLPYMSAYNAAGARPHISSTKALTGHGLSLAGAMETAFCAMALRHAFIPGSAHITTIDPACAHLNILQTTLPKQATHMLNNSSGFGGANVSIVLKKA